jgi:RNA polymerase sigma factor (sigma-70 family)
VWRRARLLRLCLRWTRGNLTDAEDLLGEACVRAVEAHRRGVEVRNADSFSAAIIANLGRDRQRAAKHWVMQSSRIELAKALVSEQPVPDEQASNRQRLALAMASLERAPQRQRQALLLRSLGDDYSCIAKTVGTSESNARKLVQSARSKVLPL